MSKLDKWEQQHVDDIERYKKEISALYNELVKEAAIIANTVQNYNPEKPFNASNYPSTKEKLSELISKLYFGIKVICINGIKEQWEASNVKNDELADEVFGEAKESLTKSQVSRNYNRNNDARDEFIKRKRAGMDLSDRVWYLRGMFKQELEMSIDIALKNGTAANKLATELKKYLNDPNKLFRRVRDERGELHLSKNAKLYHPSAGRYRSSFKNARRLAATEVNIAYRSSDFQRWQQLDFVVGIRISLSNNHTLNGKPFVDMCDYLQGLYPKDYKFTGWHPLCRCIATAELKTLNEIKEDNEKIIKGESPSKFSESSKYVNSLPSTYKKWIKENSDKIARSKHVPYYVRDNRSFFNSVVEN